MGIARQERRVWTEGGAIFAPPPRFDRHRGAKDSMIQKSGRPFDLREPDFAAKREAAPVGVSRGVDMVWIRRGNMAEFCLDCWNRIHGAHCAPKGVKTDLDLCEGCGQQKPVIVTFSRRGVSGWLEGAWRRLEYLAWRQRR